MALDADQYRLNEVDHQAIFDHEIRLDLFAGAKPANQPVAVIFGGQPGAGKSVAVEMVVNDFDSRGGSVQIIGDNLRSYHPDFDRLLNIDDKTAAFYTDKDTGKWVEKAIEEAKAQRVNIVIEGTMRDAAKVAYTMQTLRAAGYTIDVRALAVNELFSQQGIMQRYENQKVDRGTGRMTTPESHKAAFDGMPGTVELIEREKLANRVTIYRRGAEMIYTNELRAGEWVNRPQAREVLEIERARPMTLQELLSYAEGFDRLTELLARPERSGSADEIKRVEDLRQKARRALVAAHAGRRTTGDTNTSPNGLNKEPYMDLDATVRRNKLGITDRCELALSEEKFARLRSIELASQGVTGNFDLAHFKCVHQYLFQDVYEWAGETRIIDIDKGSTVFEKASLIAATIEGIQRNLETKNYLKDLTRPEFAKHLAQYYKMWCAVHPFREGIRRSTWIMLGQLSANAGWLLDIQRMENGNDQWDEASKRSFNGDVSMVTSVLTHAVRDPRAVLFEHAERDIALRIYPDLAGAYNALDAISAAVISGGMKGRPLDLFMKTITLELGKRLDDGVRTFDPQRVSKAVVPLIKAAAPKLKL
jgi:fido (protein-threonine AMPylation protein)